MNKVSSFAQKGGVSLVVLVQLIGFSFPGYRRVIVRAQESACSTSSGSTAPTGSSSYTYSYSPTTCMWENDYYSWDPVTKIYSAKYDQTPVLNAAGTAWEYPQWTFVSSSGSYVMRTISEPVPPPAVAVSSPAPADSSSTGSADQQSNLGDQSTTTGGNVINNTGALSDNNINNNSNTDADLNLTNNTSILSMLNSSALSGDASVLRNTFGGSATSGDASTIANYLNMIMSGWNPMNGDINTFNADLYGTIMSDILFNPNTVLSTGASSSNNINNQNDNNLQVTSNESANIVNDINLDAKSGDATVSENTNAGDATTGDATAIANIINMINSSINSNDSFIGNVNIHGDFDGDILLPANIMAMLMGTGAYSKNSINNSNNTDAAVDLNKYSSIENNIDLNAQSGAANVIANTNAGDATTGDASTNVAQQNYVGVNGTGTSGLLVFVNVLGKWVGMVLPNFSSINNTGAYSANNINNNSDTAIDAEFNQDYRIKNNINADATSGDATVSKNTNAGDATSGDASAAANVLNMIDSNLTFTNWFGVLFINVFGSWNGSFGVDTAAGGGIKPVVKTPGANTGGEPSPGGAPAPSQHGTQPSSVLGSTVSRLSSSFRRYAASSNAGNTAAETEVAPTEEVVADAGITSSSDLTQANEKPEVAMGSESGLSPITWLVGGSAILAGFALYTRRTLLSALFAKYLK